MLSETPSHSPALESNRSLLLSLGTIPNPLTLMHFGSALLLQQLNVRGVKRSSAQRHDAFVTQRVINLGNSLLQEAKEGAYGWSVCNDTACNVWSVCNNNIHLWWLLIPTSLSGMALLTWNVGPSLLLNQLDTKGAQCYIQKVPRYKKSGIAIWMLCAMLLPALKELPQPSW